MLMRLLQEETQHTTKIPCTPKALLRLLGYDLTMMTNMPLISVIVPIYNVYPFLIRCVNSILEQTYRNLEVILVDDGSSDGSSGICDKFSKIDSRVVAIHQENKGLSGARNRGIDLAKGDYFAFIDSDDFIEPKMIEALYRAMINSGSDMSICSIQRVDETGSNIPSPSPLENAILTKDEVFRNIIYQKNGWVYIPAWNKLYSRFLFDNLRYPERKLYEDGFLINDLVNLSSKIATTSEKMYCYTSRNSGIMNNSNVIKRLDGLESRYLQYQFYKRHGYLDCLSQIRLLAKKELYLISLASKQATTPSEKNRINEISALMTEIGAKKPTFALRKDLILFWLFSYWKKK